MGCCGAVLGVDDMAGAGVVVALAVIMAGMVRSVALLVFMRIAVVVIMMPAMAGLVLIFRSNGACGRVIGVFVLGHDDRDPVLRAKPQRGMLWLDAYTPMG